MTVVTMGVDPCHRREDGTVVRVPGCSGESFASAAPYSHGDREEMLVAAYEAKYGARPGWSLDDWRAWTRGA